MRRILCLLALGIACTAQADTTLRHSVLYSGQTAGSQTTTFGDDGSVRVSYSYRDNEIGRAHV